jgi:hypothetical protein
MLVAIAGRSNAAIAPRPVATPDATARSIAPTAELSLAVLSPPGVPEASLAGEMVRVELRAAPREERQQVAAQE